MKKRQYIKGILLSMFFLVLSTQLFSQCQNRALDFDGVDDYVEIVSNLSGPHATIEGWFKSTSTNISTTCNGDGQILFSFGDGVGIDFVEIGECNGDLFINSNGPLVSNPTVFQLINTSINPLAVNIRNNWHHISLVTHSIGVGIYEFQVFLDCVLIYSTPWTGAGNTHVWIGKSQDPSTTANTFKGQVDELRLWHIDRSAQDLCNTKNCVLQTTTNKLAHHYKFDQGDASLPNPIETSLVDSYAPAVNGVLHNFGLNVNTSNWICSTSPVVYPDLTESIINILEYPGRSVNVSTICSGDPVHFCLEVNGATITSNPNIRVKWQYSNANTSWTDLPGNVFNGFCFAVPPGFMTVDCSSSQTGRENQAYRAVFKVYYNNNMDSCEYVSKETKIGICCPLDNTSITATVNDPNNLLCDMDIVNFQVSLTSAYPFLTIPATGVTIDWRYNGLALPSFANLTSFSYPNIMIDVNVGACFDATVTSCGKTETYQKCFSIDPIPQCGTIKDAMNPNNLTFISTDVYEICPGEDAGLMIDNPFSDCIPTWQYRFDQLSAWTDLGSTNSMQNTNILPSNQWPISATKIYYRIECRPLSDPSGCEPCNSNEIEIRLEQEPIVGAITGPSYICFGSSAVLTHIGLDPALNHQWYCNGDPVGTGLATFTTSNGGCYWVESTDGCHTISTAKYCLDLCIITPVISCPDICPRPGVAITMSACGSEDTCGQSLTYQWAVSGSNIPTINGCMITHIPDPGPNTYSVTVTNAYGCSASTSTTITPCSQ